MVTFFKQLTLNFHDITVPRIVIDLCVHYPLIVIHDMVNHSSTIQTMNH